MRNLTKIAFSVTMAFGGVLATNAHANEWYYGVGGGQFEVRNLGDFKINNSSINASGSYNEGVGGTITIGRHIKGPFSIEASYTKVKGHDIAIKGTDSSINYSSYEAFLTNNGEFEVDEEIEAQLLKASENGVDPAFKTDLEMEQDIYNVSATYRHQLNNTFYAKAKVGVSYYDLKIKSATTSNIYGNQDVKKQFNNLNSDEIELVGGVGIGARLSSCCNIEVNYDSTADYQSVQGALVWRF